MSYSLKLELPDDFHHFLKNRAELSGRSLEEEAFVILTEDFQKAVAVKQRRAELLDTIKTTLSNTPDAHIMSLTDYLDDHTAGAMLDGIKQPLDNKN